jgi:hypothetical protein
MTRIMKRDILVDNFHSMEVIFNKLKNTFQIVQVIIFVISLRH